MKKSDIFKEALRYQLKGIVLKKFFPDEQTSLTLKYDQRLAASNITFSWGFAVFLGIDILFMVFCVFRYVSELIPLAILSALSLIPVFVLSCFASALYLFTVSCIAQKQSSALPKRKNSRR